MKQNATHISIRGIDRNLWREFRSECIRRDIPLGETLNHLLQAQLKVWEEERAAAE
jgi:hypothetical protein